MITITDKGAEKVRDFLNAQGADLATAGLRVGVRGGGCSGFQYNLAFDQQRDGDIVFESHGIKLLVDSQSLPYVTGSTIEYVDSLQGAGFQVNNPNVIAACACCSPSVAVRASPCAGGALGTSPTIRRSSARSAPVAMRRRRPWRRRRTRR